MQAGRQEPSERDWGRSVCLSACLCLFLRRACGVELVSVGTMKMGIRVHRRNRSQE